MTQEISSLMDGELDPHDAERAIRACGMDESRKHTWFLYHAIGEAMRGQPPRSVELPVGVARALKDQPAVVARRKPEARVVARVAIAAAASVATVGVVGWLGSQGGSPVPSASAPMVAKMAPAGASSIQPVANTTTVQPGAPVLDVQEYLVAHRQMPSPELYRPVTNTAPVPAR